MSEQPPDHGAPRPPYNPYAQPDRPSDQPLWQGTQAPEQGWSPDADAGRRRRRWLIALVMLLLLLVAGVAVTAAILAGDDDTIAVTDLEAGMCFDADNLGAERKIDSIKEIDCGDGHDAEVFVTVTGEAGESLEDYGQRCVMELALLGVTWADLDEQGIEVYPLIAEGTEGEAGTEVICFIRSRDGAPLTGSEFE